MATLERTSSATPTAEEQAKLYINGTVAQATENGAINAEILATKIRENAKFVSDGVRMKMEEYLKGVLNASRGSQIDRLERGVGGQYDGTKKTIAASTLIVKKNIADTLAQTEEVAEHETYHEENAHMAELAPALGSEGDTVVTIGGKEFDERALIEGLTVERTGEKYVSDEYRQFRADLGSATQNAGLTLEQVEQAVNEEKNLTPIDDQARELEKAGQDAEQQLALAA